jgi:hypothetical protein
MLLCALATNIEVYFCDPQSPWQREGEPNTIVWKSGYRKSYHRGVHHYYGR